MFNLLVLFLITIAGLIIAVNIREIVLGNLPDIL